MTKIDIICARLRDLGVFFIGVAALVSSVYFIYERIHSPMHDMEKAMQRAFTQSFEKSVPAGQKR